MATWKVLGSAALGCALVVGCGAPPEPTKKADVTKKDDDGDHDHEKGPNGGTVFDFEKTHAEFCMDHGKKQATVYFWTVNMKKAAPIDAEKLTLSIKSPAFQVELVAAPQAGDPKGKASRFVAVHENFGTEQEFAGTVSGKVGGKDYAEDFKEEKHDHDHGKKK